MFTVKMSVYSSFAAAVDSTLIFNWFHYWKETMMASLPSDNTKSRQILGANYEIRQYINFVWQGLGLGPDKDEAVL